MIDRSTASARRAVPRGIVRNRWFRGVFFVVLLASAVCAAGVMWQRRLIYPAPSFRAPDTRGASLLRLSSGSQTVHALYYAPRHPSDPVLVYFHGNGEQLASVVSLARAFVARGLGVLAVEYPGYGLSARTEPNEKALYDHAERAIRHLQTSLGVARSRIVLAGWSLGTGVATEMAKRGLGARLVLLSPFTTMAALARHLFPALPTGRLILDRYDSAGKAPSIAIPVLIVHGVRDRLIPIAMGRRLAKRFPNVRIVEIASAGHNDIYHRGGAALLDRIVGFARQ